MLLTLCRGRLGRLLLLTVFTALAVFFQFLTPQVIRFAVDAVIGVPDPADTLGATLLTAFGGRDYLRDHLIMMAALSALCALGAMLFNFLRRYTVATETEKLSKSLRDKLFSHVQRLTYTWHVGASTGDIIQRLTSDVDTIKNFLSTQLGEMMRGVFLLVVSLVLMISMEPFMTLVSVCLMPFIFLYSWLFSKRVAKRFLGADEAEGALQATAQENFTGVRVVRAFGREAFESDEFRRKNRVLTALSRKLGDLEGWFWGLGDIFGGLQIVLTLVFGIARCAQGQLSEGTFLTFYMYVNMMIWPVRNLGRVLTDMSKAGVSFGRLNELLQTEPEMAEEETVSERAETRAAGASPDKAPGSLTFSHVTFAYGADRTPVLKDVSFSLKRGQTLAVLGPTGSGKSTLAHLILRLFELPVGGGAILLDDEDIRTLDRNHLRHLIGLMPQETFLFSQTVAQNIALTRPEASFEDIQNAARLSCVDESILGFDNGYDTVIGERGQTLSGGQRQRVAIARTLTQNAPILIFDDSLSAVDTETDRQIRDNLKRAAGDAMVILISHRLATVKNADHILVLRDGMVEQQGCHDELMARDGTYRRLYQLQYGE